MIVSLELDSRFPCKHTDHIDAVEADFMCDTSTEPVVDTWSYNEILCLNHFPQLGGRGCSGGGLAVAVLNSVARNHLEMWGLKMCDCVWQTSWIVCRSDCL